ncbi:hypothetical protein [Kordia sp.]|uniref:hypothetical protein n=1 Tax=Kordia sp. TaxID=1965332 RepID=UPI003D6A587E
MKKKNLKKLSLNKDAISNLDQVKGGVAANGAEPVGTRVGSGCPDICESIRRSCGPDVCITENGYGFPCSWLICAAPGA